MYDIRERARYDSSFLIQTKGKVMQRSEPSQIKSLNSMANHLTIPHPHRKSALAALAQTTTFTFPFISSRSAPNLKALHPEGWLLPTAYLCSQFQVQKVEEEYTKSKERKGRIRLPPPPFSCPRTANSKQHPVHSSPLTSYSSGRLATETRVPLSFKRTSAVRSPTFSLFFSFLFFSVRANPDQVEQTSGIRHQASST